MAEATATLADALEVAPESVIPVDGHEPAQGHDREDSDTAGSQEGASGPGQVVREKQHPATPMTVDEALFEMELVGHDFYLFQCAHTGQPTVVYHRHAYDYGLIRLAG